MAALIASILTAIGPLVDLMKSLGPMISAVSSIIALFHSNTPSGQKAETFKNLSDAARVARKTGNTSELLNAVAQIPNTVSE